MFSLKDHQAKIANVNPRAEKHGEDNELACDVKLEVNVHNSTLHEFGKDYLPFLFRKADQPDDQPSLVPGDSLTALAKPNLKPLQLEDEFPGYTFRIGSGLAKGKQIVMKDAELSGFKFEAKDGGTVAMTFTATVHPDADQAGRLCDLIQDTVDITLEPPTAEAQRSIDDGQQQEPKAA